MDADQTGYAFNVARQSFLATQLTIADTHYARLVGLVGRPKSRFGRGAGLWIVPCHGVHTMFMRYPIDVVYLDDEKRVIRIEHSVSPWRVTPVLVEAATVLELPAHTAWDTGTMLGDQIEIKVGRGIRDGDRIANSA